MIWSSSTWEKSGLRAASKVRSWAMCHLRSRPAEAVPEVPLPTAIWLASRRCPEARTNGCSSSAPAPLRSAEAVEPPVERDRRRDVARDVGPQIGLLPLGDEARGLKAPALDRQAAVEAQHPQRDPDLRRPAPLGARGLGLPVFVPLPGVGGLVDDLRVGEHAGDVHGEHVGALAVVARIDVDVDPLALRVAVAAGQSLDDRRVDLLAVEPDVDRRLVVEHAQHGLFRRRRAVEGKRLRERRGAGGQLPDPILEPAVDERRGRRLDGDQVGRSGALIRR